MQYIELNLATNVAEIKSVDGELAEGNVGSVELHIINAPDDWDGKTVWATFIKGEVELPCITSKENNEYVTPVPDYVFIDDRNFGIYVWCVGGQNYIETRRILRIPVAETGTFSGETVNPETISSVDQLLGAMQTLTTTVQNAENDRYQKYGTAEADRYDKYYKAEGLTEEEIASDDFESRQTLYLNAEAKRTDSYHASEEGRDDLYIVQENRRQSDYNDKENKRDSMYNAAEANREKVFGAAESERNSAESVRQTNEESRQSFEGQRRIAESSRKNAETVRQSNETERQSAEAKREDTINSLSDVALSGDYKDLKNTPAVFDTYRPYYSNALNSNGVKNAIDILVVPELNNKVNSKDLSKVATSGSYNDLSDVAVENVGQIASEDEFDRYTVPGIYTGIYADNRTFFLIVSNTEIIPDVFYIDQILFTPKRYLTPVRSRRWQSNSDVQEWTVPRATYDKKGNDIFETYVPKSELKSVATSGDYNNLINKPFVVLENYPNDWSLLDEISNYIHVAQGYGDRSILVISGTNYEDTREAPNGENVKLYKFRQYIIESVRGFIVREKAVCNNYPDWSYDWKEVPLDESIASKDYVASAIADLVKSAPETLDTLKEIAEALNNDPDFANTILTELGKKANSSDLSKVATSGKYEDLLEKPITVLENYPSSSELDDMLYGCYVYNSQSSKAPSMMVLAGLHYDEGNETPDGNYVKKYIYRQYIIGGFDGGIKIREKAICDNYADWNYDWREVPLNDNTATKEYVDSAIGDALEGVY